MTLFELDNNYLIVVKQVQDFITKYKDDLEDEEKTLKRAIKGIQNNISWMERFSDSVRKWLTIN